MADSVGRPARPFDFEVAAALPWLLLQLLLLLLVGGVGIGAGNTVGMEL
jgi:hypothetical protein